MKTNKITEWVLVRYDYTNPLNTHFNHSMRKGYIIKRGKTPKGFLETIASYNLLNWQFDIIYTINGVNYTISIGELPCVTDLKLKNLEMASKYLQLKELLKWNTLLKQ